MPRLTAVIAIAVLTSVAGCVSPQERVMRGDDLSLQGDYARALQEYRKARGKDPAIPGLDRKIHQAQVRLFMQRGDDAVAAARFSEARRAYEEVARLDPDNRELDARWTRLAEARADWHYTRGERLLSSGDPFGAIPELEQALEIRPGHARARAALDRARRQEGERAARAASEYDEGLAAMRAGRMDAALEHFERALDLDPNHPGAALDRDRARAALIESLVDQGDETAERGDWTEALKLYEIAARHAPTSSRVRSRIERAQRELEAEQWIAKGDLARRREDWRQAFESYEQARLLTSEPQRFADLLEEARRGYTAWLEAAARDAEREGRYEEALAAYGEILEAYPGHPQARAWLEGLTGRLDAAAAAYRAAHAALIRGDLLAARKGFRDCVEVLPDYLDAAEHLDDVRRTVDLAQSLYERAREAEAAGRWERARILFEECLAVTRPFRDAGERLEEARAEMGRDREHYAVYEDACRAQAARDFERALTLLDRCRQERPGYRDVAERIEKVRRTLDGAIAAYRRAQQAQERHDLAAARDAYGECLTICRPYRDAEDRLSRIEQSLEILAEASRLEGRRRPVKALERYRRFLDRHPSHPHALERVSRLDRTCAALETDYARLVEAEKQGDYRRALGLAVKIRKQSDGYEDVKTRIARLELEADYADARVFEEAERWELARRAYERCVERDPDFRDARERQARCRDMVTRADPY